MSNAKVADLAISNVKLASNSVSAAKIASGAVGTSELADGSVTYSKLANNSVREEVLGDLFEEYALAAQNGWGGTLYYTGFQDLVFVHYARSSTSPTATTIATMPFGYRPKRTWHLMAYANGPVLVTISTSGAITASTGVDYMYFNGFFFRDQF